MKLKFTSLLLIGALFSVTTMAQDAKTSDASYSILNNLTKADKANNDAKAIEGSVSALSGYAADATIDISILVDLTNTDEEYADSLSLTFPTGFTINSVSNDDVFALVFDDGVTDELFNGIDGQTVTWGDNDNVFGGIFTPDSYEFSVNVTVDAGITGDQTVDFFISGDGFGPDPADLSGTFTISEAAVEIPLDFELPADSYSIIGFGGAQNTGVIPNPDQSGLNVSANVWQQTQDAANTTELFAGAVVTLDEPIPFDQSPLMAMEVWTPVVGDEVTLKIEDGNGAEFEQVVTSTVAGEWETMVFDFTGQFDLAIDYPRVVVFFNNGSANIDETYYADNIRMESLPTIFDIVEGSDVHTTLETALIESGLNGVTGDPESDLTLFAPTDAAFDALPDGVLTSLLDDPTGALVNVLLYHVVGGTALSGDLSDGQEVLTLQGETVTVSINGSVITINGAEVTIADLEASNGVVHVIDAVLVPEYCTSVAAVYNGLFADNGDVAPAAVDGVCPIIFSNFQAWASEIYLVNEFVVGTTYTFGLSGGESGAWVPQLLVVSLSTGEIIAVGDEGDLTLSFEVPEDGSYGLIVQEAGFCGEQSGNLDTDNGFPFLTCESSATITDIVVNSDIHTTLETAVIEAGLDGTLAGEGPFTVFAPTDAAFDALPDGLLDDLLADPTGDLTTILTHHVANGIVYSTDLSDGQSIPTLQGEDVTVGIDGEGVVTITSSTGVEAEVTVANIIASNGVVHVIDAVLIPNLTSVENLTAVEELRVFPNPTNNQFTVDIELNASERVTVDLVNIVGQVVKSVDLGTRSVGLNREYIDVNDLSEGIYFMNLTVGETQGTVKVQVVR